MSNPNFSPALGYAFGSTFASTSGQGVGQTRGDGSGNMYRFCLNTDDVAIYHGQALARNALHLAKPGFVTLNGAASGIGVPFEGVAFIPYQSDLRADSGEYFWSMLCGTFIGASGGGSNQGLNRVVEGQLVTVGGSTVGLLVQPEYFSDGTPATSGSLGSGVKVVGEALSTNAEATTSTFNLLLYGNHAV
ncbi:MAG: hypothetical protein MN733_28450 [Nitrososphaera sp.]|nr:hypothetical protein [Nitrososphaera sp.]